MYYLPEVRVTSLARIRRERLLPVPGEVLVKPGSRVEAMDIVARTALPGGFRVIEAAKILSVREEELAGCLVKGQGENVQRGDVIARGKGFLPRVCRSPLAGRLRDVRGGKVLIEAEPVPFDLTAHLSGKVIGLIPARGVIIETLGALLQGLWGTGGEALGVIKVLTESPEDSIEAEMVDTFCHGAIIVGRSSISEEALRNAKEIQVRGVVVGSVDSRLLPYLEALPFPLIATEGIGNLPMSEIVFAVLQASASKEASISADMGGYLEGKRPEIIIPAVGEEPSIPEEKLETALKVGAQVRITRPPHLGKVGQVLAIPLLARAVESGARFRGVEVELKGEGRAFVPWMNLELVH
ncbi:MAG: hypothetical protein ACUVV0_15320 [Anaerolineae bacterium]